MSGKSLQLGIERYECGDPGASSSWQYSFSKESNVGMGSFESVESEVFGYANVCRLFIFLRLKNENCIKYLKDANSEFQKGEIFQ